MRQRIAVVLVLAGFALTAVAQRGGGGRGGFSGGGFRGGGFSGGSGVRMGGVAMPGGRSFGGAGASRGSAMTFRGYGVAASRGYAATRVAPTRQLARPGSANVRMGNSAMRMGDQRGRRGYPVRWRAAYPYPYGISTWVAPDYLGYPYLGINDDGLYYEGSNEPYDSASLVSTSPGDTYVEAPQTDGDQYAQGVDTYGRPLTAPEPEAGVTLIFKDRRPPETIHNYMLTQTELMVIKGQRQYDIPVADLDVAATEQANKAAGIAFELPHATP